MDVAVDCGYIYTLVVVDLFILFSDQIGELMNYS